VSRITSLSTQVVSVPIERPVVPHGASDLAGDVGLRFVDNVVVHVDTEEGQRGSAYVWTPSGRRQTTPADESLIFVLEAAVRSLAPVVVGEDVFESERIRARVAQHTVTLAGGLMETAYSGVDMAIWDAMCKIIDQPLHRLLGGCHRELPAYTNELLQCWPAGIDELVERAHELVGQGYGCLKMPLMAMSDRIAVERVKAVREAIGPEIGLAVDLACTLTFDDALRLGRRLDPFDLAWLEDPFPIERVDEYARLSASLRTPVGAGETSYSRRQLRELVERHALSLLIFEPMRAGGITGALKLGALAEFYGVPIQAHVYHTLAAQLLSGFPTAALVEYLPWWDVLFDSPANPRQGFATPSDRPGIGIDLDHEALARYEVSSVESAP
jgi:L-alanine-DL-glutamate epimerase-like enolase superfamily enzyme